MCKSWISLGQEVLKLRRPISYGSFWEFQDPYIGLIYGKYLQSIGSWNGRWFTVASLWGRYDVYRGFHDFWRNLHGQSQTPCKKCWLLAHVNPHIYICLSYNKCISIYNYICYDIVIYCDILWYIMIYYATLWYIMTHYDILWYIMISYDILWHIIILWYIMLHYDTLWHIMIYYEKYDILWYIMTYYDTSWYIMIHYDIFIMTY